ncbi:MAG: hypothetical protein LBC99_09665 [Spirochaetota bacterium]|jgi:outer membrane lipoprotein-sorting protein|nr:hypothetical protein [Spirochaetota bacterium]
MKKMLGFALVLALVLGAVAGCGNAAKEYQKEAISLYNDGIDFYNGLNASLDGAESKEALDAIEVRIQEFNADFQTKTEELQKKYTGKVDFSAALSGDLTTAATGMAAVAQDFGAALTAKKADLAE